MKKAIRSTLLSSVLTFAALPCWAVAATMESDPAFTLDLGGQRFDPLVQVPRSAATSNGGSTLRLIQFDGPIRPEWLDSLAAQGIQALQYIHPYSYVVWSDDQALTRAATLAGVRWRGDFLPEYKVPPAQRSLDASRHEAMVLVSRYAKSAEFVAAVEGLGGAIKSITPMGRHFSVAHLELGGDRFLELAGFPAVYAVQQIVPRTAQQMLRGEMSNQAVVGAYGGAPNYTIVPGFLDWLTGSGYDGTGVIAGIVDGGVFSTHNDLSTQMASCVSAGGSPTSCGAGHSDHGTHVAAAVAGSGSSGVLSNGFLRGLGVAPGAQVISQRYEPFLSDAGPGGMLASGMLTIFRESALSNAVIANNSWGPTGTPQGYDIPTQQIDIIARDALPAVAGQQPVIPVWSIMNGGGDGNGACAPASVGSPDEAKNLFAVGSTTLQSGAGAQQSGIFNVSSNSAHGNACDGRRIPHIVAPGCSTDSATNSGANAFTLMCGTSMASPVVTGAASLFIEKYRDQNAGATPSPALVKAAFTAVAADLEGFNNADSGVMGHRPDRFQGYGRLDLDAVINPSVPVMLIDQSEVFSATGQSFSLPIAAAQPGQPIQIMLAWTDAPGHGLGGTTPAWVNDLDLSVTAGSDTYLGNVVGTDGWSASGGTADPRNNLEGVFLNPSQHGGFVTLSVEAVNIAADALNPHAPGSPAQDFALACYNCVMGEGFGLTVEPGSAQVCAPDNATSTVSVAAFGSFAGAVALTASDLPVGLTAQFDPSIVDPAPGTSSLTLSDTDQVASGTYSILIHGESVGETPRTAGFDLSIAATLPSAPLPVFPADAATMVPTAPTLEWTAAPGATGYLVEVATDQAFNDLVFSTTTQATQATVSPLLSTSTRYWWRVTANNACGTEASVVQRFTTEAAPGDCPLDSTALGLFEADFGAGLGDFSTAGSTGAQTWGISSARPSPISGGNAAFAANLGTVSDQHLTSSTIALPTGQQPLTLKFQNWREIEQNDSACWDGGILEIAVDGGAFTQVPGSLLLNDPYLGTVDSGYQNPLAGLSAWCNVPPRAWADTLVDLSNYAGGSVQLRWRLGTDSLVSEEGWYIDDIRMQSCVASVQADLAIEKSVNADVAVIGTDVSFTLTARNFGSSDATEVVVDDLLPSGYTFVAAMASTGSYDDASGAWTIGELADGASATLEITATVLASGMHLNSASISGAENDSFLLNNTDSISVTAIEPPTSDLSISMQVDATGGGVGEAVTFTLTALNAGPSAATGVVATDLLPDGYAFSGSVASSGSYDGVTGEWTIGGMAVDASETLTISALILMEGSYENSATIEGTEPDPQAGNNSASASADPVIVLEIFATGFEAPAP